MDEFQQENFAIFDGLYTTLSRTKEFSQHAYYKLITAQRHYYFMSSGIHLSKREEEVIICLDEALHKFYWGNVALEQLWGVHHYLENPYRALPDFFSLLDHLQVYPV